MANLHASIQAFHNPTSEVNSTKQIELGSLGQDNAGNVYLYVDFQQALAAGEVVVYDEAFLATNATGTSVGPLGIVIGTVSASDRFGWILIKGSHTAVLASSNVRDNGALMILPGTTNVGSLADFAAISTGSASDAGNIVYGMFPRSATGTTGTTFVAGDGSSMTSSGIVTVQLNYPFVIGVDHTLATSQAAGT